MTTAATNSQIYVHINGKKYRADFYANEKRIDPQFSNDAACTVESLIKNIAESTLKQYAVVDQSPSKLSDKGLYITNQSEPFSFDYELSNEDKKRLPDHIQTATKAANVWDHLKQTVLSSSSQTKPDASSEQPQKDPKIQLAFRKKRILSTTKKEEPETQESRPSSANQAKIAQDAESCLSSKPSIENSKTPLDQSFAFVLTSVEKGTSTPPSRPVKRPNLTLFSKAKAPDANRLLPTEQETEQGLTLDQIESRGEFIKARMKLAQAEIKKREADLEKTEKEAQAATEALE